jgi:hypothetical protein
MNEKQNPKSLRRQDPLKFGMCGGLVAAGIIYLVLGLFLLQYYRYQINPDGISYISIARKYLNGDFTNAVNGCWGPFISWLLAPFLHFNSDALLMVKVLNLIIGMVTIIALWRLSCKFKMTNWVRTTILFSAIPVIWTFAFRYITPDLLLTCVVLFYLAVISSSNYPQRLGKGILGGILGGLGYLTKSFAFLFFICHFFLMNVFYYFRVESKEDKRKVVKNFLAGTVAFALISGIWIGLLSNKYGTLTFGSSGKVTMRWQAAPGAKGSAVRWQGFVELPNKTAISAWEDPSYLEMPPYNPFGSWANFWHQTKLTAGNMQEIGDIFIRFSFLSLPIVVAYVLFWLRKLSPKTIPVELFCPTVTIILIAGAYSTILVKERFLWVIGLLLILMGGYVLARLFENNFFTKRRVAAILIVFFLSFAVPALLSLRAKANTGKNIYSLSQVLKSAIKPGHNIASNSSWPVTMYLCYHLDCKDYGVAKKGITNAELKEELKKYKTDYYFVWGGTAGDHNFLADYVELTGGRFSGLRIFGLKKPRLR